MLCCGYTSTDFPISIRLTSLAPWQSNDCPSASKATLMNMDKYLMWIHYERLHNHNKAKHNKTVCIFLGIYRRTHCEFYLAITHKMTGIESKWLLLQVNFSAVVFVQGLEHLCEYRHRYTVKALIGLQVIPYNDILYCTLFVKPPYYCIQRVTMPSSGCHNTNLSL